MFVDTWRRILGISLIVALMGCAADKTDSPDKSGSADTYTATKPDSSSSDSDDDTVQAPVEIPALRLASVASDACPAEFQNPPESGQHNGYPAEGQERGFYLQLPNASSFIGPRPLMILFNGTSGTGLKAFAGNNGQDFLDSGFIVLAPDSIGNGTIWPVWDAARTKDEQDLPNKDLIFVESLLNCIAGHHEVDQNRIYVAGMSAGGIMSNHVLQRWSSLLAGGIVASGVFDFTSPIPPIPMEPMGVVVTWGGDNDIWGGDADRGDVNVPEFIFAEQASLASAFYASNEGTRQIWVRGNDLGHSWVGHAAPLFIDYLLAHPKGFEAGDWALPETPDDAAYSAGDTVAVFETGLSVDCPESGDNHCQSYCQLLADCAVENTTVGPVLGPQLTALGFTGEGYTECAGCLDTCATTQTGAADAAVLSCFSEGAKTAECSGGISGAMPLVDVVNNCCDGRQGESDVCQRLCGSIMTNSVVVQTGLFPSCEPYAIE